MPATYESIATTTLGSNQASVTFSSLGSYTDIIVIAQTRCGLTNNFLYMRFNGDTGTNYSFTRLIGNGSSATSDRSTNTDAIQVGYPGNTPYCLSIINIANYSNSTAYKTVMTRVNRSDDNASIFGGTWRNTAAVTSITFLMGSGDTILAGSTFSLYGVKSA